VDLPLPHSVRQATDLASKSHQLRGFPVRPTRRQVVIGTTVLGTTALVLGGAFTIGFGNRASADSIPTADLMEAGPLGDQVLGAEKAPVTIIEYASMTCPHCAKFAVDVFPKLKEQYIDTGKVRFIFREFPFDALAAGAFMLARCSEKDKYFPLIETLFKQQSKWVVQKPMEPLLAIAKEAGFTQQSFEACLANQKVLEGIEWVRNRATEKFKVDATPTFFINGEMHKGEMTLDEIQKAIQPYLKA
jgi:protein-disulfide isomerase